MDQSILNAGLGSSPFQMNILVGLEWPYTAKAPEEIHVLGYNLDAFLHPQITLSEGLEMGVGEWIFQPDSTALPYLLIFSPHPPPTHP